MSHNIPIDDSLEPDLACLWAVQMRDGCSCPSHRTTGLCREHRRRILTAGVWLPKDDYDAFFRKGQDIPGFPQPPDEPL